MTCFFAGHVSGARMHSPRAKYVSHAAHARRARKGCAALLPPEGLRLNAAALHSALYLHTGFSKLARHFTHVAAVARKASYELISKRIVEHGLRGRFLSLPQARDHLTRQVRRRNHSTIGHRRRHVKRLRQFACVQRPVIPEQSASSSRRNTNGCARRKRGNERSEVIAPLAQRRQDKRKASEPRKQVLAKLISFDEGPNGPVCGRDHAQIQLHWPRV